MRNKINPTPIANLNRRSGRTAKASLLAAASLAVLTGVTPASTVTWDINSSTTGAQDGTGTWTSSDFQWWNGTATNKWVAGDTAVFGAATGAAGTVSLGSGSPFSVGGVTFNAASSGNYTLTGGTLAFTTGSITSNVNATINSAITASGALTLRGTAALSLNGNLTASNGFGLFGVVATPALFNIGSTSTVTISGGAIQIGRNDAGTLTLNGGTVNISSASSQTDIGCRNTTGSVVINSGNYTSAGTTYLAQTNVVGGSSIRSTTGNFSVLGGSASLGTLILGGNVTNTATAAGVLSEFFHANLTVAGGGSLTTANAIQVGRGNQVTAVVDVSGGTVNTPGFILLPTDNGNTNSSAAINISGGVVNIGASGISKVSTDSTTTTSISLSNGTVGALNSDWNSSLNMTLKNGAANGTDASGNINFRTSGTNGTSRYNIGLSGVLSGTGGLNVNGGGKLSLTGSNTYTGATTVQSGTLALGSTGSIHHSSSVSIASDGVLDVSAQSTAYEIKAAQTLTNRGIVQGNLAVSGSLAGSGTVEGDLTFNGASTLSLQLRSTTDYDNVAVTGQLTLGGTLDLVVDGSLLNALLATDVFTLISNSSSIDLNTKFDAVTINGSGIGVTGFDGNSFTYDGHSYQLQAGNVDGGTVNNDLQLVAAVPEPGTWAMLVGGMGMLALSRRFFRRNEAVI